MKKFWFYPAGRDNRRPLPGSVVITHCALEAWERMTFGGLRIDGFTKVQVLLNRATRELLNQ